jgi:hypothetical protein
MRSIWRALGYGLAALLVFLVTSGLTAQAVLLPRARAELEKDLKAMYNPEKIDISFDSKVFLVDMTTGRLPRLRVDMDMLDSAQAASAADRFITPVKFSRVTFDLTNVHFDRRRVLGGVSAFEAEGGEMTARVSEGEFNRFLHSEGFGVTVTIAPGELSTTAQVVGDHAKSFQISAKSDLEITGTALALEPKSVDQKGVELKSAKLALEAVVPIPPVAGIRATKVELGDRELILTAPAKRLYGEAAADVDSGSGSPEELTQTATAAQTATPAPSPTGTTAGRASPTSSPTPKKAKSTPSPTSTRTTR